MNNPAMDIPSQFSPSALLGETERCLAFRCVVKRINHEENLQVRQKFNCHRSRLPVLDSAGRYASPGARERFLQHLALHHRPDLEKAGFTAKQISQMTDLRPFDPRADQVIWRVHHKIPIRVSGLLKDPNDFKKLVFLPGTSIEPSCTVNTRIDSLRVSSPVTSARLASSSRLDASVRLRARSSAGRSNSVGTGLSSFRHLSLSRCCSKGLRGRSHPSTRPWGNCEKADLQTSRVFVTRCLCPYREEVEAFSV
jgi:hypothetical protein